MISTLRHGDMLEVKKAPNPKRTLVEMIHQIQMVVASLGANKQLSKYLLLTQEGIGLSSNPFKLIKTLTILTNLSFLGMKVASSQSEYQLQWQIKIQEIELQASETQELLTLLTFI